MTTSAGNENSSKWKKLILIAVSALFIASSYYFIIQTHVLEDSVFHFSSESGKINNIYILNTIGPGVTGDYGMYVNYESKGAFMAGREIRVSINFMALNNTLYNSRLVVVFPGALNVPIQTDMPWSDASIELKFINESTAVGEGKIIYYMPEYNESVLVFKNGDWYEALPAIYKEPKYTYYLIINETLQKPENVIIKNRFLSIAPLETYLQLKINNWLIFLTFIAVYLALTQIMYRGEK